MPSLGENWLSLRIKTLREFPIVLTNNNNDVAINEIDSIAKDLIDNNHNMQSKEKLKSIIDQKVTSLYKMSI